MDSSCASSSSGSKSPSGNLEKIHCLCQPNNKKPKSAKSKKNGNGSANSSSTGGCCCKPIPEEYKRCINKFQEQCYKYEFRPRPPPLPLCCNTFNRPRNTGFSGDGIRQLKCCQAELQKMRNERWREQERKAIMEDKRRQELLEQQQLCKIKELERANEKCERDRERRKALLKNILCYRKEMKQVKDESRKWRRHQQNLLLKHTKEKEEMRAQEFCQDEDERRWNQEKCRMQQEDKLLDAQMRDRDTTEMTNPELEELRRMFVPVEHGPKETFEYFVLEPRPTEEEIRKEAEEKARCLLGLRDNHGMHLNVGDKNKKKTTISLSMGPKHSKNSGSGYTESSSSCKIVNTPGAFCSNCLESSEPNVEIPKCLKSLMQTLSYRVSEIDTPLLSLKTYDQNEPESDGKEVRLESGPNFNGTRLYGTIVLPKGEGLSPFYTQPFAVTF